MAIGDQFPHERNALRMLHWVFIAAFLYFIAFCLASNPVFPQASTIAWKLGNAVVAAYLGYWLDRHLFRIRISQDTDPLIQIRRAIIVAALVIAVSMGV